MTLSLSPPVSCKLQETFFFFFCYVLHHEEQYMCLFLGMLLGYLWHIYLNMGSIIFSDFKKLKYFFMPESNISFFILKEIIIFFPMISLCLPMLKKFWVTWHFQQDQYFLMLKLHLSHGFIKINSNFPVMLPTITWDRGW